MSDRLDTVRKLLAQAAGTDNENEAQAFNDRAMQLMAQYGIDDAMLAAVEGGRVEQFGQSEIRMHNPYSKQKSRLLNAVGNALNCKTVVYDNGKSTDRAILFGYDSDRERVEMLYTSLLLQATSQLVHQHPGYWGESVAAYRRSWLDGFTNAVYARLMRAERSAVAETGNGAELVLVDRKTKVEQAYREAFPRLGTARPSKLSGTGHYEGAAAGRRADLGVRAVGGQRRALT